MKTLALLLVKFYRFVISPIMGPHCRFYPSCSSYAETALQRFGFWRGSYLALRRLLKCHPWHSGGCDPVPEDKNQHSTED